MSFKTFLKKRNKLRAKRYLGDSLTQLTSPLPMFQVGKPSQADERLLVIGRTRPESPRKKKKVSFSFY